MSEQHQDEPHSPVTKSSAADGERQVGIIKLAAIQIKTEASSVYEKTDGIHCYDAMQDGNKSPSQGNEDCHDNLSPEDPLKHSDSNLSDELEVDQNSFSNLFKHPYIRKQWRSIALAGVLLLAGFSFLMTGVILIINHSSVFIYLLEQTLKAWFSSYVRPYAYCLAIYEHNFALFLQFIK
ncbi:uncharacterized protein TRIADDRAFT_59076 [Trichoplax adhaerens]|uniref:Uncharacterized protein n=1 Tax=Trichoplax adhaerens TaxID=10228 RepID=B3S4G5_TRIAD|nr:predicted protein [Trichoplax adhaerens]EDV22460.1 predicted protein [Trichoplax adhaerens]|eukprot:XP_002115004.1 predicted protein [Trichoplax adhaerens]